MPEYDILHLWQADVAETAAVVETLRPAFQQAIDNATGAAA